MGEGGELEMTAHRECWLATPANIRGVASHIRVVASQHSWGRQPTFVSPPANIHVIAYFIYRPWVSWFM
jgi:hypothetical protein